MADIGGIGGFNPAVTRSTFDPEAAAQRRADERARQEELQQRPAVEDVEAEEQLRAEEANTQQQASQQSQEQDNTDTVTLSNAAQDYLTQAQDAAQAANDDATVDAATDTEAVTQIASATGLSATNQTARNEESTSTVNGNQNTQSEQTRALGQVVDQYA